MTYGKKIRAVDLPDGGATGGGPSLFGVGWSLPLGAISRRTTLGTPLAWTQGGAVYDDSRGFDLFIGGTTVVLDRCLAGTPCTSWAAVGSALLAEARLEAQLDGGEVYGMLVGADDRQIGTFTGTRARKSLSGTYTFANGDTGEWSWRGELPE